jgi:hypothetical protein
VASCAGHLRGFSPGTLTGCGWKRVKTERDGEDQARLASVKKVTRIIVLYQSTLALYSENGAPGITDVACSTTCICPVLVSGQKYSGI